MYSIYLTCFLIGATLMVGQILLGILGLGHHGDGADHDFHDTGGHDGHGDSHDADDHQHGHESYVTWFASVLTVRALIAALTFFGLVGLAGTQRWPEEGATTLVVAVAGAVGALLLVASLMRTLHKLKADGTVHIDRTIGKNGTVYLTIPGWRAGVGKVTVTVQNRTMEYQAVTTHNELPTGAKVVVTAVVNSDTVEVLPVPSSGV
jgi:hypothetical protein